MSETDLLPPPDIEASRASQSKWDREHDAFQRLRPTLLRMHVGQYVAIHEGQVVDSGADQVEVALRVYERFGYQPIFVGLVSEVHPPPIRIPSSRILR